jgi:glycosyltransferase involved in cell wall biosynthesis
LAIEAVAGLVKRGRDVRLVVVGRIFDQGYANSLFALAKLLGIGDLLTLLGSVEADQVSRIMARSRLGLHLAPEGIVPSSGSLLAFLAHGVPTIAAITKYDSPVLRAVVNAIPYSVASLEDAIDSALDDPAGAERLGAAGQRAYRDAHTWPQAMGAILDAMIGAGC